MKPLIRSVVKFDSILREVKRSSNISEVSAKAVDEQIHTTTSRLKEKGIEPRNKQIFNYMVKYMAETKLDCRKNGLFLFGTTGTGKSFAAKVISSVRNIHYYCADELVRIYQENKEQFWGIIEDPSDLVIDDLGDENTVNDYGTKFELLGEALKVRHRMYEDRGHKTIITCNMNGEAIKERYSERIYSRIRQMCECVNCHGDDLRLS